MVRFRIRVGRICDEWCMVIFLCWDGGFLFIW